MGNNSSTRQYTYQQYYRAVIKQNKNYDFSKINLSILDPYEVLEVPRNFTWEELKTAYKTTALLTHPDKEGGNRIIFNFVTDSFKTLAEEYKSRAENKSYLELKKQAKDFYSKEDTAPPPDISGDNFNEKFNKKFEMCRMTDEENDFGYGDMMTESSNNREDLSEVTSNLFQNNKFNNQSFNSIFVKHTTPPPKSQIIKYKDPEPIVLAKTMNYTEIGGKKPDDYSSSVEKSGKNNLIFSDYKLAHSNTRLVDEETFNIKNFKNVEEYQSYRTKKFNKGLTEKEKKYFELKKIQEEKEEYDRLQRIKQNDAKILLNNEKASRLFLK
uniref:J domain-containing protein n=1 Tax=viral metagenome TaxID=1070528 RepID=A0A6C0LG41_9ZZZZ